MIASNPVMLANYINNCSHVLASYDGQVAILSGLDKLYGQTLENNSAQQRISAISQALHAGIFKLLVLYFH